MSAPKFLALHQIQEELSSYGAKLVAVSKTRSVEEIKELVAMGQFDFGENYVQELLTKKDLMADGPVWHFIGHLQSNKVRQIIPFVHLIHGVGTISVLKEISKRSTEMGKDTEILFQVHIAEEESKSGFDLVEVMELFESLFESPLPGLRLRGLMGMATFTEDHGQIRSEFKRLKSLFDQMASSGLNSFDTLSMGMSSDYQIALDEGSTMVRIGSKLFGPRG